MNTRLSDPLCVFCSSSLEIAHRGRSTSKEDQPKWKTPCCSQPICENCLVRNPRLLYYNPCLKCLSGVGALAGGQRNTPHASFKAVEPKSDDRFVIADDEDGSDDATDKGGDLRSTLYGSVSDPPNSSGLSNGTMNRTSSESSPSPAPILPVVKAEPLIQHPPTDSTPTPPTLTTSEYFIKPKDTLRGIALALGVDARKLCVINKLPLSTMSTSPQLLHTRISLKLPPDVPIPVSPPSPNTVRRTEMERTEKRIQLMAKEPDPRVAKTYAALAEPGDDLPINDHKEKAAITPGAVAGSRSIAERAIDAYYDDVAWEEEINRRGGDNRIPGFPYFSELGEKSR